MKNRENAMKNREKAAHLFCLFDFFKLTARRRASDKAPLLAGEGHRSQGGEGVRLLDGGITQAPSFPKAYPSAPVCALGHLPCEQGRF